MSSETTCFGIPLAVLFTILWVAMVLYADYIVAQFKRLNPRYGQNISTVANILCLHWQSPSQIIISTGLFATLAFVLGIIHWLLLLVIGGLGLGRFAVILFSDARRIESFIAQMPQPKLEAPPLQLQASPVYAFLFGRSGEYKGVEFQCVPKMQIGRRKTNDLILREKRVSRKHARLEYANGMWYIQDIESTTGTYVNGKREQAIRLKHGDIIKIGSNKFEFKEG